MRECVLAGLVLLGSTAARGCGTVVLPTGVGISGTPAPVATMHPVLLTGSLYETELINLIYRPLVWVANGPSIDWDDSLASAIEASADDTVFTVTLKDYAWSDGRKVTSADVLYDWSLIRKLGQTYSQYGIGGVPTGIRSVSAPDAHHLRFETTQPSNPEQFELAGLSQFYALPRQAWAGYDIAAQQSMQSEASFYTVVDGPFRLQSLTLGQHAVFVANPSYSGHHASVDRVVVEFLQGVNPLQALQAGQIDMASLPFPLWNAARSIEDVARLAMGPAPVDTALTPNLLNPNDPFFRDVRVRQAIARAIDQKNVIETIYHGQAQTQTSSIPSALEALIAPDLRDGKSPMSYDPAAAKRLLDEAGWRAGLDGVRVKDGRRLAFSVLTSADNEVGLMYLQTVQADLASVGISVAIKQAEFNQLLARMIGPKTGWDATFFSYTSQSFPDPSQVYATGAYGNYEGYSDATMDRLLAAAARDPTLDGLYAVEDYAVTQQPVFFLPNGYYNVLSRPGIGNIHRAIQPNGLWALEYLTVGGAGGCDAPHA